MHDVCFGYLDHTDEISLPFIAEKVQQLTRLSVTRHYQAPQYNEAKTVDELLKWFTTQIACRYLVIIKYGVLLDDRKIVHDAISDLTRYESLAKAQIIELDGRFYLSDRFVVVDRVMFEKFLKPEWGSPTHTALTAKKAIKVHDVMQVMLLPPNSEDTDVAKPFKGSGWGFIESGMRQYSPILGMTSLDHHCLHYLDPTIGTEELAAGFMRYGRRPGNSVKTLDQQTFLFRHSSATTQLGRSVEVFDTESIQRVCGEKRIGIHNLYSLASGFKPLRILQHHGFGDITKVFYYDISEQALVFRKILVSEWDGTNLPAFMTQLEANYGFHYPLMTDSREQAWHRTVTAFGGPRAFKQLWDRYRKLEHTYRCVDARRRSDLGISGYSYSPHSYIWFSDVFCTNETYIEMSTLEIDNSFCKFIQRIKEQNPLMILDGRDPNGRWV